VEWEDTFNSKDPPKTYIEVWKTTAETLYVPPKQDESKVQPGAQQNLTLVELSKENSYFALQNFTSPI
jgi:hypothetical protein